MRTLFYYYKDGTLVFRYNDEYRRITMNYVYYTLREALHKFRKEYGLQRKHIKVKKLY